MKVGIIGLGKMGLNLANNLKSKGYEVYAYNRSFEKTEEFILSGGFGAFSLEELCKKLDKNKFIIISVPYNAVEEIIEKLTPYLQHKDVIADFGNSYYESSIERFNKLKNLGVGFLDVGISGGPSGALNGASLMIGGDYDVFKKYENVFKDLSLENSYAYIGKSGTGHFVKMVHNGIEYGMMQAIAEGIDLIKNSELNIDIRNLKNPYSKGSVIESRLVSWFFDAIKKHGVDLENVSGKASMTGEGEWALKVAKRLKIRANVLEEAIKSRLYSQKKPNYQGKIISALREQFGGHKS